MMNSASAVSFATIFLCAFLINEGFAQEEMQCRSRDLKLNETQIADTLRCVSEAGTNSIWKIPATKMPCFGMCILTARGFVSDDGEHLVLSRIVEYIAKVVKHEKAVKPLTDMVTACVKEHGDKISAKNDPSCMSFMEVGQCVRDAFMEVCVADDDDE